MCKGEGDCTNRSTEYEHAPKHILPCTNALAPHTSRREAHTSTAALWQTTQRALSSGKAKSDLVVAAEAFAKMGIGRPVLKFVHGVLLVVLLVQLEKCALPHSLHIPLLTVNHLDPNQAKKLPFLWSINIALSTLCLVSVDYSSGMPTIIKMSCVATFVLQQSMASLDLNGIPASNGACACHAGARTWHSTFIKGEQQT